MTEIWCGIISWHSVTCDLLEIILATTKPPKATGKPKHSSPINFAFTHSSHSEVPQTPNILLILQLLVFMFSSYTRENGIKMWGFINNVKTKYTGLGIDSVGKRWGHAWGSLISVQRQQGLQAASQRTLCAGFVGRACLKWRRTGVAEGDTQ